MMSIIHHTKLHALLYTEMMYTCIVIIINALTCKDKKFICIYCYESISIISCFCFFIPTWRKKIIVVHGDYFFICIYSKIMIPSPWHLRQCFCTCCGVLPSYLSLGSAMTHLMNILSMKLPLKSK